MAIESTHISRLPSLLRTLVRWFDSHHGYDNVAPGEPLRVDWLRNIPFFAMHGMCLFVLLVGWSWPAVAVCVGLYFARMFFITGFYHRYFSHKAFSTSRPFQFVMAICGLTAVQRGPLWWAAHHRHHHLHSDEEDDPHSPHTHHFIWAHMGWITSKTAFPTKLDSVRDLARFPELVFVNRFDTLIYIGFGAAMFALGTVWNALDPAAGTSGFQMLIWAFFISTILVYHATYSINSLAHTFGRKRYDTGDESRNSLLLALLTLGEGWHNNHHHYPVSARQGFYWWEVDITYYGLVALQKLGLIWNLKPVPRRTLVDKRIDQPSAKDAA